MEKIPFTVSARTARLLGRENVSNSNGAIIELIKNTYDADAKYCYIIFDNKNNRVPKSLSKGEFENILMNINDTECLIKNYKYENEKYILNDLIDDNEFKLLDKCFKRYSSIYIIDNGDGMTEDIIKNNWMTIGTDNKAIRQFSDLGRVKTGAKGIGRFALDKLGSKCKLITKSKNNNNNIYCWNVEWGDFEKKSVKINDVYATLNTFDDIDFYKYVENISEKILNKKVMLNKSEWSHGTIIQITDLRDEWDDFIISKVFQDLEILTPPNYNKEFEIVMFSSDDLQKYGEVESSLCDDYDYKIEATIENKKMVNITIYRNEFDLEVFPKDLFNDKKWGENFSNETLKKGFFTESVWVDELVPGYKETYGEDIFNDLGKFELSICFMKRGYNNRERKKFCYREFNFSGRSEWLNKFGGIKLFRDNFRVRPYGEVSGPSFDWLMLGERSNKSPAGPTHKSGAWRVRPNQVAGSINISRIDNLYFEDKSSREGIQESPQFNLLKKIILNLLKYLERDRQKIMKELSAYFDKNNDDEVDKEKGKVIANKIIKETKIEVLNKCYKNENNSNLEEKLLTKSTLAYDKEVLEKELLAKSILAYDKENKDLKIEIRMLRALASTGLVITSFAHELKNISARILPRSSRMKKLLGGLIDSDDLVNLDNSMNPLVFLDNFKSDDEKLKFWLDFSLHVIRKDKRKRNKLDLYTIMRNFKLIWTPTLNSQDVTMNIEMEEGKELMFRVFPIDVDSIFNNLIANSLDAFRRNDANNNRDIYIKLHEIDNKLVIIYKDSGPGLNASIKNPNDIFEPFVTTKLDKHGEEIGTGLGMWIVKSTVDEYKGMIRILNNLNQGFGIEISFPLKKDEGFRRI